MVRCVFSPSLLKVKEEKQQHNTKNLCGMMSGNTEFRPTFFRSVAPIKVGRNRLIFFFTASPKNRKYHLQKWCSFIRLSYLRLKFFVNTELCRYQLFLSLSPLSKNFRRRESNGLDGQRASKSHHP